MNAALHRIGLRAVTAERLRQVQLKTEGRFEHTCADPEATDGYRLTVLVEEVGEVARAVLESDGRGLREELVQVAAVAVAWIEGLDAEGEVAA
jgi:hypothetical protein